MRRVWEFLGGIILTAVIIYFGFLLLKPFAPWLVLGAVVMVVLMIAGRAAQRGRYW